MDHKKATKTSITIEEVTNTYLVRNNKKLNELTEFDQKFIQTQFNIRNKYKKEYDERAKTIFLKESPKSTSIFEAKKNEKDPPKEKKKISDVKEENSNQEKNLCSATLMNGKSCTSPAKTTLNGKPVCGRHKGK